MHRSLTIILIEVSISMAMAAESFLHYPLTAVQAQDASTLNKTILSDKVLASQADSTRKIRWVCARFFSHEWKDGPWHSRLGYASSIVRLAK